MREDVVNCEVSDIDSSERLLRDVATLTRSVGSVLALSDKVLVLWVEENLKGGGWGRSRGRGGAYPRRPIAGVEGQNEDVYQGQFTVLSRWIRGFTQGANVSGMLMGGARQTVEGFSQ